MGTCRRGYHRLPRLELHHPSNAAWWCSRPLKTKRLNCGQPRAGGDDADAARRATRRRPSQSRRERRDCYQRRQIRRCWPTTGLHVHVSGHRLSDRAAYGINSGPTAGQYSGLPADSAGCREPFGHAFVMAGHRRRPRAPVSPRRLLRVRSTQALRSRALRRSEWRIRAAAAGIRSK